MFNWYDDADVQIIGFDYPDFENLSLVEQNKIYEEVKIIQEFNDSMRYKNVIKRQEKEIKELEVQLLEEKLKNAKNDLKILEV